MRAPQRPQIPCLLALRGVADGRAGRMVDTPGSRSLAGGRTSTWGTDWIVVDTKSETSKVIVRLGKRRWSILDARHSYPKSCSGSARPLAWTCTGLLGAATLARNRRDMCLRGSDATPRRIRYASLESAAHLQQRSAQQIHGIERKYVRFLGDQSAGTFVLPIPRVYYAWIESTILAYILPLSM